MYCPNCGKANSAEQEFCAPVGWAWKKSWNHSPSSFPRSTWTGIFKNETAELIDGLISLAGRDFNRRSQRSLGGSFTRQSSSKAKYSEDPYFSPLSSG